MKKRDHFDLVGFVEAAYRMDEPDAAWLDGLVASAVGGLDQGLGVGGVLVHIGRDRVDVRSVRGRMDASLLALVPRTYDGLPPSLIARYFSGPPDVTRLSDDRVALAFMRERVAHAGRPLADVVGAQVGDGRGNGLTLAAFASRRGHLDPTRRRSWLRLMSHAGAALRLRNKLRDDRVRPDALLDPNGRVCHAERGVVDGTARHALVDAVRAMERARGRLRTLAPEEALSAWHALVAGTWSVVDWIDVDGRRYLAVYENRLSVSSPRALTVAERMVAEYLLHGRSASETAYALGLRVSAVETITRRALRKLGGARRTDLASIFGAPEMSFAMLDDDLFVVGARPRAVPQWDQLSKTVREVVEMAVAGASNEEIARARGRSVRTVANQLARTYALFGVRGRAELAALLGRPSATGEAPVDRRSSD